MTLSEVTKSSSSIQRLHEFSEYEELEKDLHLPKAPENWPREGNIEINDLKVRYRKGLPLVLDNVSCKIENKQKIGIVGRTGSGKSTMLLALTRILELSEEDLDAGSYIKMNGVETHKVGLHELRKNITVIPQDPIMLQGTVRFNVDPMGLHTEDEVIEALKKSQVWDTLKLEQKAETVNNTDVLAKTEKEINQKKLEINIDQGGSNLSVGQKQLICVARAFVRKPKFLIMDEATANIDEKTDQQVQELIKSEFKDTTVLTIAHR